MVNQIHTDGQIWATAMMQVWDAIGKTKADKSFWNGIGMTNSSSNQNDAANAVFQASIGAGCTPAQRQQIHTIFTNRGYTLPAFCPAGNILYVNDNAIGLNDGTSWANAFNNLQFALELAGSCPNITQIWVAAGTYYPTAPNVYTNGLNVRDRCFQMKNGLAIYGGFNGSEALLSERNVNSNVTTISGDIGTVGNNGDNCFHVFYNVNVNSTAILDGFTITGGNANSGNTFFFGGGMYNINSPVTIANCTFLNNSAQVFGGGIYNSNSSTTITNCSFTGNAARYGGGLNNDGSAPIITNCTFTSNSVSANGGGVHSQQGSTATITNCKFTGNTAEYYGGGVYNLSSGTVLANCSFSGNSGSLGGGGFYSESGSPTVTNCSFSGNFSPVGAGVKTLSGTPSFKNCIIWGNSSAINTSATVTYSIVEQASGVFTGTGNLNVNPLFASSSDLRLLPGSPAINAGTNSGAPATDIRGITRPQQTTTDMGAYEMQGFTMAVAGGNNQSALISSNFPNPLSVTVSSAFGEPVNGGKVTFTSPGSGASAGIAGNPATISSGTASSGTVTANSTSGGPYTVSASAAGVATSVSFSMTNNCPTSFTVNDAGDAPDANPGNGIAATAGGVTTLRAAIMEANAITACSPLTINFSITGDIVLSTALQAINHPNLTITGPGASQLTVRPSSAGGTPNFRLFTVNSGKTVVIEQMTVTNGNSPDGGAIRNSGNLTVNSCTISGSTGTGNGGGGIANTSILTLNNCLITGNTSTFAGGGLLQINGGTTTATNCIFTGNTSPEGGAITSQGINIPATMNLVNCALYGNHANNYAGALSNVSSGATTILNMTNTTIAHNSGAVDAVTIWSNSGSSVANYQQRFSLKKILLKTKQLQQVGENIFPAKFAQKGHEGGVSPILLIISAMFSHFVLFFAIRL